MKNISISSIYLSRDIEDKVNRLLEEYGDQGFDFPDFATFRSSSPLGSIIYLIFSFRDLEDQLGSLQEQSLKDLREIERFVAKSLHGYEVDGEINIYGDKEKLGYFLRSNRFSYGGEK